MAIMTRKALARWWAAILLALPAVTLAQGVRYSTLEDAAVAQAKAWQKGDKARPLMSADGKVIFAYGQSMPRLTCSPTRACDVEMQPGESVKKVILGDGANWKWEPAESIERGKTVQHVVLQPRDNDLESNAIITTDRRSYHIKLYAPKKEGIYLNRVGFYYPEDLVSDWEEKAGATAKAIAKDESLKVTEAPVPLEKLDFDYRVTGDSLFKPLRVFNNGSQTLMEMPPGIVNEETPVFALLDEKDQALVVNYRPKVDTETGRVHYVVDKLFYKGELRIGKDRVQIVWNKRAKGFWPAIFSMGGGG